MLPILNHLFNLVFTSVDVVSDIMLAIDYCVVDAEWCALTWSFIAGSFLTLFIIALTYFYSDLFKSENGTKDPTHAWIYWKATEVCLEAGQQLVLQLCIIALSEQDPTSTAGKIPNL